jgi:cell division protein FtsL
MNYLFAMYDLFQSIVNMQTPFNMFVLVTLIGCSASAIGVIATQTRKYFCHRHEIELKRDLVARGLSVEEIERVIAAKPAS